jgi:hypothetical protein
VTIIASSRTEFLVLAKGAVVESACISVMTVLVIWFGWRWATSFMSALLT